MSKLSRDAQMVRAGAAKAAITGYLTQHIEEAPIAQDRIMESVSELDMSPSQLGALLYRMADNGLIVKHAIEHPHYKVGYTCTAALPEPEPRAKRSYTRQSRAGDSPIDVRVNEKEGSVTIRYAGMVLTFSREDR